MIEIPFTTFAKHEVRSEQKVRKGFNLPCHCFLPVQRDTWPSRYLHPLVTLRGRPPAPQIDGGKSVTEMNSTVVTIVNIHRTGARDIEDSFPAKPTAGKTSSGSAPPLNGGLFFIYDKCRHIWTFFTTDSGREDLPPSSSIVAKGGRLLSATQSGCAGKIAQHYAHNTA